MNSPMYQRNESLLRLGTALGLVLATTSCGSSNDLPEQTASLQVIVSSVDGTPLPTANDPLPVDTVRKGTEFKVKVNALGANGEIDTGFNGFVTLSMRPGYLLEVVGEDVLRSSVRLKNGQSSDITVKVTGAFGAARIWAEDMGYLPGDPFKPAACGDLQDNDGDGKTDFPSDPGCAFADDDNEEGGTYATGVSEPLYFALPRLADAQGWGGKTPFHAEQVELAARSPAVLIVSRISTDGFYVTDVGDWPGEEHKKELGFNHLFAFNFNAPYGMRVCDRLDKLTGTLSEFYGFTELSFPSYQVHQWRFPTDTDPGDGPCLLPEPRVITDAQLVDPAGAARELERSESGLVRVINARIAAHMGPESPVDNVFKPGASNCDLNRDGRVNYDIGSAEAACSNACLADPECSEWSSFQARGNFRLVVGQSALGIQANVSTVPGFDPSAHAGETIAFLTGTLRTFSGGSLNWTIEARCADDFVYCDPGDTQCQANASPKSIQEACVQRRTDYTDETTD